MTNFADRHHHDHDHAPATVADLRELLDRLTGLENAASEFDGHNEMACQTIGETSDEIFETAMKMDNCVVRTLGSLGMVIPAIAFSEDEDERWDLLNAALCGVLQALEHVEDLVAGANH